MATLRFLSRAEVVQALPMADAIEGMKSAYAQLSSGQADMPLRARVAGNNEGVSLVMPAHLKQSGDMGVKIVSVFPNNPSRNLPIIHALVLALDPETGQPLALFEGGSLTAIRTGAGAGAATDILARQDSSVAAIIGSGIQARTQLEAVCTARKIEHAYVYSPNRAHAERFAAEMAGVGVMPATISVTDTPEDAIREADIVCAATTSKTPVFDGTQIRPGTHINGVGSFMPEMIEFDAATLTQSLIVVDQREAMLEEAGEILAAMASGALQESDIHAELGEIINGSKTGRTSDEQVTFFKSVGVAVQDAISAWVALRNAEANNIGTMLEM